jgi:hypothetical protein
MRSNPATTFAFLTLCFICTYAFSGSLPKQATISIHQLNKAAKAADFATLQSLMTQDFIWSFGGDASASQAIAEWKTNPDALKHLIHVTEQPCSYLSDNTVECPRNAGLGYRAGFKLTNNGWRMYYFVQGD